eukprot:TRINITY_DN23586_c0_g1_i2.p1 TRINITY_DN23586_c0_g1~~TRINITY_DN23586_c0_g1_i2.p1  ORF type:complete len:328 (-),score=76.00 TRINITY_DN23586_c0_g1_i2:101-1084(-)
MGLAESSIPEGLPEIDDVKQVLPGVIRVLGQNPGLKTLQGTNTYLVGTGFERLILDTSDGNSCWWPLVEKVLAEESATITEVLLTHAHSDHVGGVATLRAAFPKATVRKWVPDIPEAAAAPKLKLTEAYSKQKWNKRRCNCDGKVPGDCQSLHEGEVVQIGSLCLRTILTPGHSEDSVCFVLENESGSPQAIFTGDSVLGGKTAEFADIGHYNATLSKIVQLLVEADGLMLLPGHGDIVGAAQSTGYVRSYLSMNTKREQAILQMLKASSGCSVSELCQMLYDDLSTAALAEGLVEQHLEDLESKDMVHSSSSSFFGTTWALAESPH